MTLWLIRHPAADVPPDNCYGRLDLPLREPAEPAIARIIADLAEVHELRTSPAIRCRRVAECIGHARSLPVVEDSHWLELDFGAWEGLSWNAVPREATEAWAENYWTIAPPGGETYRDLIERVRSALMDLAPDRDTAIVSHAGPIRAALALCLEWSRERYPVVEIGCGTITGLRRTDRGWERC
jgi:alpha-ribazole phosphatase